MIAYKWVIKKDNLYHPLINFKINGWMKDAYAEPYEIGKEYNNSIKLDERNNLRLLTNPNYFELYRYHFWKQPINEYLNLYNEYFKKNTEHKNQIKKYLTCDVSDIIKENNIRLICRKFVVLKVSDILNRN
jgi:hypothetical protein